MKTSENFKILARLLLRYLKTSIKRSFYKIFWPNYWKSINVSAPGLFDWTAKSLKKFRNDMAIFKAPAIVGLKIIYYKSLAFLFENNREPQAASISEDNFLYRDLSNPLNSTDEQLEKELKIFRYPTIENLKSLYYKSIGKS